jgi:crossover junction endodeoxyribonuclease RusA
MPKAITLQLPYPASILSPNSAKRHWKAKQPAKEAAREYGYYLAVPFCRELDGAGALQMQMTIYPPNRVRRDLDNVFSAMKSALDGICRGLAIDDSQIRKVTLEWGGVVKGGAIEIELKSL